MKIRYKIIIITVIVFIPVSIFFPQIFLVFHLDKYETNATCDALNGHWDWINDICELYDSGLNDPNSACLDLGGTFTCAETCDAYGVWTPWQILFQHPCKLSCPYACEFGK
jgi:hypothetical protein